MKASTLGEASGPVTVPLTAPESFNLKVFELMASYETHPDNVRKDGHGRLQGLQHERIHYEDLVPCVDVFDPRVHLRASRVLRRPHLMGDGHRQTPLSVKGPWLGSLHWLRNENKVVGEAFHKPTIQSGDKEGFYPFLWPVMRLDVYQRFLKKRVADFDGV